MIWDNSCHLSSLGFLTCKMVIIIPSVEGCCNKGLACRVCSVNSHSSPWVCLPHAPTRSHPSPWSPRRDSQHSQQSAVLPAFSGRSAGMCRAIWKRIAERTADPHHRGHLAPSQLSPTGIKVRWRWATERGMALPELSQEGPGQVSTCRS